MNPDDRVLPTFCPFCGRKNDRHQSAREPATPEPGDLGICWGCGNVFVFDAPVRVRRPTTEEQAEIDEDLTVALARGVMRESGAPSEAVAIIRRLTAGRTET